MLLPLVSTSAWSPMTRVGVSDSPMFHVPEWTGYSVTSGFETVTVVANALCQIWVEIMEGASISATPAASLGGAGLGPDLSTSSTQMAYSAGSVIVSSLMASKPVTPGAGFSSVNGGGLAFMEFLVASSSGSSDVPAHVSDGSNANWLEQGIVLPPAILVPQIILPLALGLTFGIPVVRAFRKRREGGVSIGRNLLRVIHTLLARSSSRGDGL